MYTISEGFLSFIKDFIAGKTDIENIDDSKLNKAGKEVKSAISVLEKTVARNAAEAGMSVEDFIAHKYD